MSRLSPLLCHFMPILLVVFFLGGPICGETVISFRDGGHFYPPLFRFVHDQMLDGSVPLWGDLLDGGRPLAANPTAAVFYPLKAIFLLPLAFQQNYAVYLGVHVWLAWFNMRRLCIALGCTATAASVGGLAFAFSGDVLFQHCNAVFLVGAAWLPAALQFGHETIKSRSISKGLGFASVLALCVLGGDIEAALLAGLCVSLFAFLDFRNSDAKPAAWYRGRISLLALAAVVAGALAAVQILPSSELSAQTTRAIQRAPASLYDIPAFLASSDSRVRVDTGQPIHWYDSILGNPPPPYKHEAEVYAFSFYPLRILEYLFPGVFGQHNLLWGNAFGLIGHAWVPSVYLGIIPFLAAIVGLRLWRRRNASKPPADTSQLWMSWILVIAMLAACGLHTPLYFVRGMTDSQWGPPLVDTVGGVYWALRTFVPFFAKFRYPGKLMVVVAAAIAMLAARTLTRFSHSQKQPWQIPAWALVLPTAVLILFGEFLWPTITEGARLGRTGQEGAAHAGFLFALAQPFIVIGLVSVLLKRSGLSLATAVLIATSLDLAIAQRNLVDSVPFELSEEELSIVDAIRDDYRQDGSIDPPRVFIVEPTAPEGSAGRYLFERNTQFGQFNLSVGIGKIGVPHSVNLSAQDVWFDYLPIPNASGELTFVRPRRAYDAWGVDYFIVPKAESSRADDPNTSTLALHRSWTQPRWSQDRPQLVPDGKELRVVYEDDHVEVIANDADFPPPGLLTTFVGKNRFSTPIAINGCRSCRVSCFRTKTGPTYARQPSWNQRRFRVTSKPE